MRETTGSLRHLLLAVMLLLGAPAVARAAPSAAPLDAHLSAAMPCAQLQDQDFTQLAEAPASIVSSRLVVAHGKTPEFCEVSGFVQPQVGFELRLPTHDWNGRYFQVGCGGLCGLINIASCGDVLDQDFAVAAQNMGHVSHFWKEPLWGSDPELRRDFGGRSTHVTAVAAKAIVAAFYGRAAATSYFRGCSTGGREGLFEAQHHPADFNGIVAGDPAFSGRLGPFANNWDARHLLRRDGTPVFPAAALASLHRAVLDQCDALDGLRDGIIDDPRACHFDISRIACPVGQDRPDCLTAEQMADARAIYDGVRNSHGTRLFPGHGMYGSEVGWNGARAAAIADADLAWLTFTPNPAAGYTHWNLDLDRDASRVVQAAAIYDPVAPFGSPDLAAFHKLGGRLIIYHGWADAGVSPLATLDYYAKVTASAGGLARTRDWFRVFMVPGMGHCRGGDAPNIFDFMPAIAAWVEHGQAPAEVMATERDAGGHVERTRPLVPYPQFVRFTGTGDVNDAANWTIHDPATRTDDNVAWLWGPRASVRPLASVH